MHFRPLSSDELQTMVRADARAYGTTAPPAYVDQAGKVIEFDRTIAAFDADTLVGHAAAYSLAMTVPGSRPVPTAGVSWVSVQPTHRRRGILTELMRRQIADIRARDEPLAALFASEAPIYGRFGYGAGSFTETWDIETRRAGLDSHAKAAGSVSFIDEDEAVAVFKSVHDRVASSRPGMVAVSDAWWSKIVRDWHAEPARPGRFFHVVHREGRAANGFAIYTIEEKWVDSSPASTVRVRMLVAASDHAYAALWRFLLGIDLVTRVRSDPRPVDDPLPWMLVDTRAMNRRIGDALYVRLVDVPGALSARTYAAEDELVLEVRDPFCPWNDGRYELTAATGGAMCRRTRRKADLALSAADLGALYLGGNSFSTLARAGRIDDLSGGAAARCDEVFRGNVAPWTTPDW